MTFPFSALVGSADLRLALLLNAVSPAVGGVLVRGEKGTAKSTAVRALAALLPPVAVVAGCRFACDPQAPAVDCPDGPHPAGQAALVRPARLVELPVGASEDRVTGALDLDRALTEGVTALRPGLLAAAHRGVLYVDEVNLLADHLVDVLLDAAALGVAQVERDGVSVRHPARFWLVGTMNPEEGELRPQLVDRFGLTVTVAASRDPAVRAQVVRRRLAFDADPAGFAAVWAGREAALAARIVAARQRLVSVVLSDAAVDAVAAVCAACDVDGMRADVVLARTAMAVAAWEGREEVGPQDIRAAARFVLPHRRRRGPFDAPGGDDTGLAETVEEVLRDRTAGPPDGDGGGGWSGAGATRWRDGPASASGSGGDGDGDPDLDLDPDPGGGGGGGAPGSSNGDGAALSSPSGRLSSPSTSPGVGAGAPGTWTARSPAGSPPSAAGPPGAGPAAGDGPGTGLVGAAGAPFRPRLFTAAGVGAGAAGRRSVSHGVRGAVVGSGADLPGLHLPATLRAAAAHQRARGRRGPGLVLEPADRRGALRRGREGNLVLFVVDASGSMAARERLSRVATAVLSLLVDAYQRRDRVGLITFRGVGARLVLAPTSSVEVGAARLAGLPTGGRTPIAAGLVCASTVLATEARREPARRPLLVLVTDGRATAGPDPWEAARALRRAAGGTVGRGGLSSVVVDCETGPVRLGLAARLADALGATLVGLDALPSTPLAGGGFGRVA